MKTVFFFAALFLAVLGGCDLGLAPGGGTGVDGLTGVVVDGRGEPVAGARVRVTPAAVASAALAKGSTALAPRAESTFTGADGRYRFKKLSRGTYDLRATVRLHDTDFVAEVFGIRVGGKTVDLGTSMLRPASPGGGLPAGALLVSPADQESTTVSPTLSWSRPGGLDSISSFRLQVSSDSAFGFFIIDREVADTVLSGKVGPFAANRTLYWRVTAVGPGGSSVSATRAFKTVAGGWSDSGWTVRRAEDGESIVDIASSGSLLVAIAGGTNPQGEPRAWMLTSTDGLTWTKRAEGLAAKLNAVAWTGTQFLAVGSGGVLLSSPDGLEWSARTLDPAVELTTLVHYADALILIGGANATFTSSDETTWTRHDQPSMFQKVVNDRNLFIALTAFGMLRSMDGAVWTTELQPPETLRDVMFMKGVIAAVGTGGAIYSSGDGIAWEKRASGTTEDLDEILWEDDVWYAGPVKSADGVNWTRRIGDYPTIVTRAVFNSTRVGLGGNRIYTKELN